MLLVCRQRFAATLAVGLPLLALALSIGTTAHAQNPFSATSYNATTVFTDRLGETTMTIAYDGNSYWSSSGGSANGIREARYDAAGNLLGTYSPGLSFRSVFTTGGSTVFARQFGDNTIYRQTAPGTFVNSGVTLTGGSLNWQSSVVWNSTTGEFNALDQGTVGRWAADGSFLGNVALSGFGSLNGEGSYPQNRGIATAGNYWLTYNDNQVLSAWDFSGVRVGTTILNGVGTSAFDSPFSLSYANNQVFVVDSAGSSWRGYNVGLTPAVSAVPEPGEWATMGMAGAGLCGLMVRARRKKATTSPIVVA